MYTYILLPMNLIKIIFINNSTTTDKDVFMGVVVDLQHSFPGNVWKHF